MLRLTWLKLRDAIGYTDIEQCSVISANGTQHRLCLQFVWVTLWHGGQTTANYKYLSEIRRHLFVESSYSARYN